MAYLDELPERSYREEIERMDKLDASTTLPVGVVSVLFGVGAYYVDNLAMSGLSDFWTIWFFVSCTGLAICLLLATISLIRSIFRGRVAVVSNSQALQSYIEELRSYYAEISSDEVEAEVSVEADVRALMSRQHAQCATENRANNLVQSNRVYWAKIWIAGAVLALLLGSMPFYVTKQRQPDTIYRVQLVSEGVQDGDSARTKSTAAATNIAAAGAETSATAASPETGTSRNRAIPEGPNANTEAITKKND